MTDRAVPWATIARARICLIAMMGCVVALAAGEVFDQPRWELLVVPCLVGVSAILTARSRGTRRLVGASVATVASVALVVALDGGTPADVRSAFGRGLGRLLSTDWPSPARPDLVAALAVGLAVLVALAAELARRDRLHLTPLLPVLVAHGGVIALSAPSGPHPAPLVALGLLAGAFALLRPGLPLRDRWALLAGERRVVPMTAVAVGVAVAVAVPVTLTDRADPRRNEEAVQSASLLDPIEAILALQAIDPPEALYRVELTAGSQQIPTRWRTVAVDSYDGRRWVADLTLRPIGRRLSTGVVADVAGTITFLDDTLQLVPLPGTPITVDALIETDADRTVVRLVDRPVDETTVSFSSDVAPSVGEVRDGDVGAREIDETVSGLSEFAQTTMLRAADSEVLPDDLLERLLLLEEAMRSFFDLDSGAEGGGLQRTLIERFATTTQRGNAEQFAAAFVLLARSLGVDARLAVGFEIAPVDGVETSFALSSADASIWPEVRIGDEWVAFDPIPDTEASDAAPEPEELRSQAPIAPEPPPDPPPETDEDPVVTDVDDDAVGDRTIATVVRIGIGVAVGLSALIGPVLLVVGAILALKWRRRNRTLAGPGVARVRGAWRVATDRLVDAGLHVGSAATNGEIAAHGASYVPTAESALDRLGSMASAATFGRPEGVDALAAAATSCLAQIEDSMVTSRTRWQRLRWRLSLRSLRRSTRSPV